MAVAGPWLSMLNVSIGSDSASFADYFMSTAPKKLGSGAKLRDPAVVATSLCEKHGMKNLVVALPNEVITLLVQLTLNYLCVIS